MNKSKEPFVITLHVADHIPAELISGGKHYFILSQEEVTYLVKNIQHEYLSKDTYEFSVELFTRMETFLKKHDDELVRKFSSPA